MSMNPAKENRLMVAKLLGVDEAVAAELLEARVAIYAAAGECARFATELISQLERTVVVTDVDADVEVVIGVRPTGTASKTIYVSFDEESVTLSDDSIDLAGEFPALHGLQVVFGACYAAAFVLGRAVPGLPSTEGDFVFSFASIGATRDVLVRPLTIRETALAGAGAVGNGFLRALRHLDVSGKLHVTDPKEIGAGNANRCLFFGAGETGMKAEVLSRNAQEYFGALKLEPFVGRFCELVAREKRIRRVVVATDSRPVRRSIQNELPLEVVDASTTDVSEIIVHSHRQPTDGACLSCIYKHVPDEDARKRDIAAGLGLAVSDIDPAGLVDDRVAGLIVAAHPSLQRGDVLGRAFDTLFKQLCGEQALLKPGGEQVLAPFAFVSNLAGAYLALELARLDAGIGTSNYLYLHPWRQPFSKLRRYKGKDQDCEFCGNPGTLEAYKAVWPEISFNSR